MYIYIHTYLYIHTYIYIHIYIYTHSCSVRYSHSLTTFSIFYNQHQHTRPGGPFTRYPESTEDRGSIAGTLEAMVGSERPGGGEALVRGAGGAWGRVRGAERAQTPYYRDE